MVPHYPGFQASVGLVECIPCRRGGTSVVGRALAWADLTQGPNLALLIPIISFLWAWFPVKYEGVERKTNFHYCLLICLHISYSNILKD